MKKAEVQTGAQYDQPHLNNLKGCEDLKIASEQEAPQFKIIEFRDAKGNILGTAEATYAAEKLFRESDGSSPRCRELLSYILKGPKGDIDLLALVNKHHAKIFSSCERLRQYNYYEDHNDTIIPPLETPIDIAILAHELGHADQFRDPPYRALQPFYKEGRYMLSDDRYEVNPTFLAQIFQLIPDAVNKTTRELQERLEAEKNITQELKLELYQISSDERAFQRESDDKFRQTIHAMVPFSSRVLKKIHARFAQDPTQIPTALRALGFHIPPDSPADATQQTQDNETEELAISESMTSDAEILPAIEEALFKKLTASQSLAMQFDAARGRLRLMLSLQKKRPVGQGKQRFRVELEIPCTHEQYTAIHSEVVRQEEQYEFLERRRNDTERRIYLQANIEEQIEGAGGARRLAILPIKILERDASRRALTWLREVRQKTGVNLFASIQIPKIKKLGATPHSACEEDLFYRLANEAETTADVRTQLKEMYRTYQATAAEIQVPPSTERELGHTPGVGKIFQKREEEKQKRLQRQLNTKIG